MNRPYALRLTPTPSGYELSIWSKVGGRQRPVGPAIEIESAAENLHQNIRSAAAELLEPLGVDVDKLKAA